MTRLTQAARSAVPATAFEGDWVVRGADGEEWRVPAREFAERYAEPDAPATATVDPDAGAASASRSPPLGTRPLRRRATRADHLIPPAINWRAAHRARRSAYAAASGGFARRSLRPNSAQYGQITSSTKIVAPRSSPGSPAFSPAATSSRGCRRTFRAGSRSTCRAAPSSPHRIRHRRW
jgi:hypothetical protein